MRRHISADCNQLTLSQKSWFKPQNESLEAVQGILGCSRDIARKLLIHFQWDKEALFGTACLVVDSLADVLLHIMCEASSVVQEPLQIGVKQLYIRQQASHQDQRRQRNQVTMRERG